jgi:hypothetical protein
MSISVFEKGGRKTRERKRRICIMPAPIYKDSKGKRFRGIKDVVCHIQKELQRSDEEQEKERNKKRKAAF